MESLAKLVALMVLTALLSAPIAILITLIQRNSTNLAVIVPRRILQGGFLALSLFFGLFFLFNLQMPLVIHAIGLYALVLTYIAIRREYFPDVRIIAPGARVGDFQVFGMGSFISGVYNSSFELHLSKKSIPTRSLSPSSRFFDLSDD